MNTEDAQAIQEQLGRIVEQLAIMNSRPIPVLTDSDLIIFDTELNAWRHITFEESYAMTKHGADLDKANQPEPVAPVQANRVTLDEDQVISLIMNKSTLHLGLKAALTIPPSGDILKALYAVRNDNVSLNVRQLLDRYPHIDNLAYLIDELAKEGSFLNRQNRLRNVIFQLGEAALIPLTEAAQHYYENHRLGEAVVDLALKLGHSVVSYTSFPNAHSRIAAALAMIKAGNSTILELIFDEDHPEIARVQEAVVNELIGYSLPEYGTND